MSLKFSDIVPKLARGEVQRADDAPPAKPAAEPAPESAVPEAEKPELEPEAPIQVETEFVTPADQRSGRPFELGEDAAQFAEDMLERAIGTEAQAAPHPDAEPPAPASSGIPKSFGFDFDVDPDAPQSELAKAVSSALSDDPPSPFSDDEEDGAGEDERADDLESRIRAALPTEPVAPEPLPAGDGWLDQPAGPGTLEGAIPTHATETVDRRDTPMPPEPPPASAHAIANELMRAVDVGDTPPDGVPSEELERLLSSALDEGGAATAPSAAPADGPALDPSHVAPGDFRGLAAGLIAELEASLTRAPEDTP